MPRKLLVHSKCADGEQTREVAAVAGVARRATSSGRRNLSCDEFGRKETATLRRDHSREGEKKEHCFFYLVTVVFPGSFCSPPPVLKTLNMCVRSPRAVDNLVTTRHATKMLI